MVQHDCESQACVAVCDGERSSQAAQLLMQLSLLTLVTLT